MLIHFPYAELFLCLFYRSSIFLSLQLNIYDAFKILHIFNEIFILNWYKNQQITM